MVVSRGKRKQKETPKAVPEPPKRLKFQAQRKFAQGQGTSASTSTYLNYASAMTSSQQSTPIKENRDPPPELLPNQRPNTEDFLTFLCFRGTSVLPPELDFMNQAKETNSKSNVSKKEANSHASGKKQATAANNKESSVSKKLTNAGDSNKPNETENGESSNSTKTPAAFPGAVRKRADKRPMSVSKFDKKQKQSEAVATALKKKYQQQRLAKIIQTNVKPVANVRHTRAHPAENDVVGKEKVEKGAGKIVEKTPVKRRSRLDKHLSNNSLEAEPPKKSPRTLIKEGGFKDVKVILNKEEMDSASKRKRKKRGSPGKKQNQDEEEDNEGTSEKLSKQTAEKKDTKDREAKEDSEEKKKLNNAKPVKKEEIERRQTRYASFRIPPPLKKERKKKIDSPVVEKVSEPIKASEPPVEEEQTKLKTPSSKVVTKEVTSVTSVGIKKFKKDGDFSSEDDEPLMKAMGKKTSADETDDSTSKVIKPGRRTLHKSQPKKSNFIDEIVKKLDEDIKDEKNVPEKLTTIEKSKPGRGRPKLKKSESQITENRIDADETTSAKKSPVSKSLVSKVTAASTKQVKSPTPTSVKQAKSPTPVSLKQEKSPTPSSLKKGKSSTPNSRTEDIQELEKKKRGRKPGIVKKSDNMESPHEFSEPEATTRIPRPSRKTKEAATIYMELIGRKLSLRELSDDDSLDSLELPNIQRMQQLEDEMKHSHEKLVEKPKIESFTKEAKVEEMNVVVKKKRGRKKKSDLPGFEEKAKDTKNAEASSAPKKTPGKPKVLEKSFSDSDEEPLAVKVPTKSIEVPINKEDDKPVTATVKRGRKTSTPKKEAVEVAKEQLIAENEKTPSPKLSKWQERLLANSSPKPISKTSSPVKQRLFDSASPTNDVLNKTQQTDDSTKVNRSSGNNSKLFSVESPLKNQKATTSNLGVVELEKPFVRPSKVEAPAANPEEYNILTLTLDDDDEVPQKPLNLAPKSLLGNLLPSKEEQNKIFGIASVSLAQSSGPLDTKCTLGKCGSVHKPSLGPAVLTESNLGGHLSPKDRRKSKVNMTHEQIQKWIDEISITPIPDNLDECSDLTPVTKMSPNPSKDDMDESSSSQKTITKTKEEKMSGSRVGSPLAKSSTSKTKAVAPKEETISVKTKVEPAVDKFSELKRTENIVHKADTIKKEEKETPTLIRSTPELFNASKNALNKPSITPPTLPPKITTIPEVVPKIIVPSSSKIEPITPVSTTKSTSTVSTPVVSTPISTSALSTSLNLFTSKTPLKSPLSQLDKIQPALHKSIAESPVTNKSPLTIKSVTSTPQMTTNTTPSTPAILTNPVSIMDSSKKPVYCSTKRTPIYKQIEANISSASKPVINTFGAFSPENEKSIYSFDEDFDQDNKSNKISPGVKKGRGRAANKTATSLAGDESNKNMTPPKNPPQVSLTLSPEENSKVAAIDVSTANEPKKEASGDGDSDSEGQTFYIPLSAGNIAGGSKLGEMIQGVKLKLGTEGPEGPNQRVIMHAKLVTKAEMGEKSTPIPEGMANMTEIVKALTSSKDGIGKSVPVGTVQPRFKSSDSINEPEIRAPSQIAEPAPGVLSRINSNSSLSSVKSKVLKPVIQPSNLSAFPHVNDSAQMVEAPVFRPTEKEFQDPIEFFERILPVAAPFGICRVIPPASFKPECRISDDMRFTAYNQYIHKMLYRWGPNAKELAAIKKYLEVQKITMQHPPWIGGMEVDLPRLYHTVQELGGLKEVIEKKKWPKVSEEMCIPKTAHDRVSKLDDIYCKYLLPYDTLSPSERQKLFDEVEADWAKQEAKARRNADRFRGSDDDSNQSSSIDEESEDEADGEGSMMECMVKGRSMPLNQFFRIARNTMSLWFKNAEPTSQEVEAEFWRHVAVRDSHVCVHSGSIDSSGYGYGFPTPGVKGKGIPCAKHPWNLKVLTNNQGSILRALGPVTGVTVPTIHVGMLFSACCWYRDPHGLPWIEYLHTGGSKIWYSVPDEQSSNFRTALMDLIPTHCQNKTIWLPCDTVMVPPHMLTDKNVSLCRTEQEPGQFIIVFPRAYTSSIGTGYTVSESVMFASSSWFDTAKQDFDDMHESCEPAMFSLEQLLFAIATDQRSSNDLLSQILQLLTDVYEKEKKIRKDLKDAGVVQTERIPINKSKNKITEENECDFCRANLSISMVKCKSMSEEGSNMDNTNNTSTEEFDTIYCLHHALKYIQNDRIQAKHCKLIFSYGIDDIENLIAKIQDRLQQTGSKGSKKKGDATGTAGRKIGGPSSSSLYQPSSSSKYSGMPTMLK